MTATHNALLGALSRYSHFDEFSEPLNVAGNILTPAERRALALKNLTDDFVELASGVIVPGAGWAGTGTVVESQQVRQGNIIKTTIFVDLTGLDGGDADGDAIGKAGSDPAYLFQAKAATHGAPLWGRVTCLEVPAGGTADIDFAINASGTIANDAAVVSGGAAVLTSGAAWAAGVTKTLTGLITADSYVYLCAGAGSGGATYTAGRFLIELYGTTFVGT